ncbi:NAD(P)/FAD-dependent oxidoreductase [Nonomuraea diastatica]|uniref:NAD(P)/FAD-dependent oxidoreductase n=1 Tax=Nonomuraea diastatica TaxID=1848329 RepID=UPI001C7041F5|nr:NAD(P)/FAD-dependent oxidoreductase [Nonomuraea diastatica]
MLEICGSATTGPNSPTTASSSPPAPDPGPFDGVHTLRTIEDALALRAELASGHEHVLVIGGGFTRNGVPVGAVAANLPKEPIRLKRAITARQTS